MLLTELYKDAPVVLRLHELLKLSETAVSDPVVASACRDSVNSGSNVRLHVKGVAGSADAVLVATTALALQQQNHLVIAAGKEEAYYLQNDIENLLNDSDKEIDDKRVLLFPTSYRKMQSAEEIDNANMLMRSEVVKQLNNGRSLVVVTYPDALVEKVMSRRTLTRHTLRIAKGARLEMDDLQESLMSYDFERADFVVEPGQYAVRGGIIDVFGFANDHPYRIQFDDDTVASLRTFDPATQLSVKQYDRISIIPNLEQRHDTLHTVEEKVTLLHYYNDHDIVWTEGLMFTTDSIERLYTQARQAYDKARQSRTVPPAPVEENYCCANEILHELLRCKTVELGGTPYFSKSIVLEADTERQPLFNKQFELLIANLNSHLEQGYRCLLSVTNAQQQRRLEKIFTEYPTHDGDGLLRRKEIEYHTMPLRAGFLDHHRKLLCYTDHEIFERYHKYVVRDLQQSREAMTMKELLELQPGDYVTHIDFGVGCFRGLQKIENNGKQQEVIRIEYKDNGFLYISIHALHKISRYVGKDGTPPTLNKLGSNSWNLLKQKTKKQVKDIAKDLIQLYAKRKATRGFAFSADSYLQNELEASFLYEDTPDQNKATQEVKRDMEHTAPMDRLVCGDVGFGKTEVAIRAAFKAVCDSKQVAVLVPSTILAFQHYNTFCNRLEGLPVKVDYLNRFRTAKEKNKILKELKDGSLDILIGTHAITGKGVQFKNLGLLIVDEEQKFGVSTKEKLRQMKVNVDCLTLTATPIPRTLQFSLMGARDLSVIQTPPANRQPIETELCDFDEATIRDAICYEMNRGGQAFFINNHVENLPHYASMIMRLVPDAKVGLAHGRMDGKVVEATLMRFLQGELDVLVATSIIENGLDIPNANTMIINNAHQFGLADLHQMRGRVGRSNKKAFCYVMVPGFKNLTGDAQRRLRAITEFSTIGSGFNIAMRDLDIRGAGNILGAEQSGFISEIGYDAYHKILNEAIEELKETDFRDIFQQELDDKRGFVKECSIETDLSVLLPDDYVSNVAERLILYKELNNLSTDEELDAFRSRLTDRFGDLPQETEELIQTITLRRVAKQIGIERLVLKNGAMVCYFVGGEENAFYKSPLFGKILRHVTLLPDNVHLKEQQDRIVIRFDKADNIAGALALLKLLIEGPRPDTVADTKQAHGKAQQAQHSMEKAGRHTTYSMHKLRKVGERRP